MSKKALGRGLGAIIDDVEKAYSQEIKNHNSLVKKISVDKISPNPYQPRTQFDKTALQELSDSIKKHGLLQPIVVVEKDDGYMLIAGERRLRATKLAGFSEIKSIVADFESQNLRELALIENIQRENLNPIELANAYNELINEYKITQEELSNIIHKSRTQITNTIRLLNLSEETKKLILESKISQGHAKTLIGLNQEDEKSVIDTILGQKLSVRETEKLIKDVKSGTKISKFKEKPNLNLENLNDFFKDHGVKTSIKNNGILIKFKSEEEANGLLDKLRK